MNVGFRKACFAPRESEQLASCEVDGWDGGSGVEQSRSFSLDFTTPTLALPLQGGGNMTEDAPNCSNSSRRSTIRMPLAHAAHLRASLPALNRFTARKTFTILVASRAAASSRLSASSSQRLTRNRVASTAVFITLPQYSNQYVRLR